MSIHIYTQNTEHKRPTDSYSWCSTSQLMRAPSLQRSLCFPSNYYQAVNKIKKPSATNNKLFCYFSTFFNKRSKDLPFCSLSKPTTTPRAPFTSPWDTSRFFANITYRRKEKSLMPVQLPAAKLFARKHKHIMLIWPNHPILTIAAPSPIWLELFHSLSFLIFLTTSFYSTEHFTWAVSVHSCELRSREQFPFTRHHQPMHIQILGTAKEQVSKANSATVESYILSTLTALAQVPSPANMASCATHLQMGRAAVPGAETAGKDCLCSLLQESF